MAVLRRNWTISLGLTGVFLAGAVTGVVAAVGYVHHRLRALHDEGPHAVRSLAIHWLDGELGLDSDQEAEIATILRDAHEQLFRFKTEHDAEIRAIVLPALDRIEGVLTASQSERWSALRERVVTHVSGDRSSSDVPR